ncbi:prolipoprotein diacylglyceryl transferase [Gimesia panareensis]|uniref:Phosphatidylglycerol--prolipoprotein diacylglyceryl transferase n=1 Tax=Gimesia panareensis TaxID=2527978 RepID=A0A518A113_9PLAN|nr:prolipoprotein diacylglyceryl transferase [Gimesia panareensis]QDT25446.1 Prolipoprotein diacylglyceryl transferase [Gimesia panareensis]QDU48407.1 Prolipoprotein diacylglyceryl transferase [Gimesia panareensis]
MNPLIAYLQWDINRVLFEIGPIKIRYYGLFFTAGFICGYLLLRWIFRTEKRNVDDVESLLIYMVLGTIIGARLGHCLFYHPLEYLSDPIRFLQIWRGGLASHGAAVGITLSAWLYSRKHPDQPLLWLLDRLSIPVALAGFFIRIGNFFNSEILGRTTDVPWAVVFKDGLLLSKEEQLLPRHPVMLYESFCYGCIFLLLLLVYRKYKAQTPRGLLIGLFFITVFSARFVLEFFKLRQAAFAENLPLSVGQMLSIPLVIAGVALLLYRRPAPPLEEELPSETPQEPAQKG